MNPNSYGSLLVICLRLTPHLPITRIHSQQVGYNINFDHPLLLVYYKHRRSGVCFFISLKPMSDIILRELQEHTTRKEEAEKAISWNFSIRGNRRLNHQIECMEFIVVHNTWGSGSSMELVSVPHNRARVFFPAAVFFMLWALPPWSRSGC